MTGRRNDRVGTLFVLSAPSGAGKSTVAEKTLATTPRLSRSISHTTRPIRKGEVEGVDYRFVARNEFEAMIERGEFIEWAEVHGNLYGTAYSNIDEIVFKRHDDLLLVIDVQGAASLRERGMERVTIFLAPPSMEELEKRLSGRGSDSEESVRVRLANADYEMAEMDKFDYTVINDDLSTAVDEVRSIIIAERLRTRKKAVGFRGYTG
ncbi:MAG: guanylate kinase [Nitrospinae bacterium]|nr:guanylate kinase [Nitrospinota bacterium]MBF0634461.1 guanylate kinase [Nitrospinota bacterium]